MKKYLITEVVFASAFVSFIFSHHPIEKKFCESTNKNIPQEIQQHVSMRFVVVVCWIAFLVYFVESAKSIHVELKSTWKQTSLLAEARFVIS